MFSLAEKDLEGHRTDIVEDVESDLFIADSVERWRETYARPSSYLTENLGEVRKKLTKENSLSTRGFSRILKAQNARKSETEIYSHIQEIVTESQSALDELSKTAKYETTHSGKAPNYITFSDSGVFLCVEQGELCCRDG